MSRGVAFLPVLFGVLILGGFSLIQHASADNHTIDFALPGSDPNRQELFCTPTNTDLVPCLIDYTINVIDTSDGTIIQEAICTPISPLFEDSYSGNTWDITCEYENLLGIFRVENSSHEEISIQKISTQVLGNSISGFKFEDLNVDGIWQQCCEPALNGWRIFDDANNNKILDLGESIRTTQNIDGQDGKYVFESLEVGLHHICEEIQTGWKQTLPGDFETGEVLCYNVVIGENDVIEGANFGNVLGNNLPVANAGLDKQAGFWNGEIQLDGSASSDPDGDDLTYKWSIVSIPENSPSIELSDETIANPTFEPHRLGDYVFQLVVNDGVDDSEPDTVVISVLMSVPNVVGLSWPEASNILISSGLVPAVQITGLEPCNEVNQPIFPPVGTIVESGSQVAVTVHIGSCRGFEIGPFDGVNLVVGIHSSPPTPIFANGGSLTVEPGAIIDGDIIGTNGASININGATVNGNVKCDSCQEVTINGDTTINGNTNIQNTNSVTIENNPNSFTGHVRISGAETVSIYGNTIDKNLRIKNSGHISVEQNTVLGHLRSYDNLDAQITENTVTGNLNTRGTDIVLIQENDVGGNIRVDGSDSVYVAENISGENLRVKSSTDIIIEVNQVGKNLRAFENFSIEITDNHAGKNINIKDNTECSESGNTADKKIKIKDCISGLPEDESPGI